MTINKSAPKKKPVYTILRVLLFYLCSVLILMFTSRLTKSLSVNIADLASIFIAAILSFILVVLFTRWEKLNLADVGVVPGKQTIARFIAGYFIGLLMAVIQALTVFGFGHLRLVLSNASILQIVLPFLLYFFVACREELVFRSYALRSLDNSFTAVFALSVITILFILEHVAAGMTWKMAVIGSGLGGILFGIAALKTKGLALPLGLHSAWNFGQWAVGFKNKPGIFEAINEKGYEVQNETISLVTFALVMILAIISILLFYKIKTQQQTEITL
jgi:membrane protease YdiL (CAAX protease family)